MPKADTSHREEFTAQKEAAPSEKAAQEAASSAAGAGRQNRSWLRRLLVVGAAAGVLLILLAAAGVFFYRPILQGAGHYLVYRSPLHPADVIVVLSGGGSIRLEEGIALYQKNYAPRLLLTIPKNVPKDTPGYEGLTQEVRIYQAVLDLRHIPADDVLWSPSPFFSTYGEGVFIKAWLKRHQFDSAIVVTGHFQARRAKWTMDHLFKDRGMTIMIAPASNDQPFTADNWWTYARGFITVENEFLKLLYYQVKSRFGTP